MKSFVRISTIVIFVVFALYIILTMISWFGSMNTTITTDLNSWAIASGEVATGSNQ